jgi:hypothetical protein
MCLLQDVKQLYAIHKVHVPSGAPLVSHGISGEQFHGKRDGSLAVGVVHGSDTRKQPGSHAFFQACEPGCLYFTRGVGKPETSWWFSSGGMSSMAASPQTSQPA